jgi:hypothetical protein
MNSAAPQQLMKLSLRRWSTFTPRTTPLTRRKYGLFFLRRLLLLCAVRRPEFEEQIPEMDEGTTLHLPLMPFVGDSQKNELRPRTQI